MPTNASDPSGLLFGVGAGWSFQKPGGGYANALRNYVVGTVVPAAGQAGVDFGNGFANGATFGIYNGGNSDSGFYMVGLGASFAIPGEGEADAGRLGAKCLFKSLGSTGRTEATNLTEQQRGRTGKLENRHCLTIAKTYVVLGVTLVETTLTFLIRDDNDLPNFAPAGMFELKAQALPEHWHFVLEDGIRLSGTQFWGRSVITMGYKELVEDPDHASRLSELIDADLMIFTREYLKAAEIYGLSEPPQT